MKVNILGTEYTIERRNEENDPALKDNDGYTDHSVKLIVVDEFKDDGDPLVLKELKEYGDRCLRHEIIHAFLDESGLQQCSQWARNEEMVDFFAVQFPKILKAFEDVGVIKRESVIMMKSKRLPNIILDEDDEMSVTD